MAGTALTLLGVGLSAAQGIGSLYGASKQAEAARAEAAFNAKQSEMNARLSEMQAEDAISRGDKEASNYKQKISQTIGSQRAAAAAQGIDVDSGSAMEIQEDTQRLGEKDVMTIKNNAWREAWGLKVEAQNHRANAVMGRAAGENRARMTLLTGGLQAAGYGMQAAKGGYEFGRSAYSAIKGGK